MKKRYTKPEIRVIQLSSFPILTASQQYGIGGSHDYDEITETDDFDEFEMG